MSDNNLVDDMSTLDNLENTDISLDTNFTFDTMETMANKKTNFKANQSIDLEKPENKLQREKSENRLKIISDDETKKINNKPFYQLSILEITIELKNTIFGIMDDLLLGNFNMNILFKDNRMFYVGLTILIISIILYIYDYAIDGGNDPLNKLMNGSSGIVEIRHIYDPSK